MARTREFADKEVKIRFTQQQSDFIQSQIGQAETLSSYIRGLVDAHMKAEQQSELEQFQMFLEENNVAPKLARSLRAFFEAKRKQREAS